MPGKGSKSILLSPSVGKTLQVGYLDLARTFSTHRPATGIIRNHFAEETLADPAAAHPCPLGLLR
jgi:hypothetical protein